MEIIIICATQSNLIFKQILLIKFLSIFFKKDLKILINQKIKNPNFGNINVSRIKMEDSLFDFSRYYASLSFIQNKQSIVFGFNDTLGNGRKLNIPLFIFILSSIFSIKKNKIDISCPIDSNAKDFWICPYFFIGKTETLKSLNWIDHEKGLKYLDQLQINQIKNWIENGWRRSNSATDEQKYKKYLTLILERTLLESNKFLRIRQFSRKSIYRILNAFFPI